MDGNGLTATETVMMEMFNKRIDDVLAVINKGFEKITDRQDIANGRTSKNEESIAATRQDIAMLHERTKNMTCIAHEMEFQFLRDQAEILTSDVQAMKLRKADLSTHKKSRKRVVIEAGAAVGIVAAVLGFLQWVITFWVK